MAADFPLSHALSTSVSQLRLLFQLRPSNGIFSAFAAFTPVVADYVVAALALRGFQHVKGLFDSMLP